MSIISSIDCFASMQPTFARLNSSLSAIPSSRLSSRSWCFSSYQGGSYGGNRPSRIRMHFELKDTATTAAPIDRLILHTTQFIAAIWAHLSATTSSSSLSANTIPAARRSGDVRNQVPRPACCLAHASSPGPYLVLRAASYADRNCDSCR